MLKINEVDRIYLGIQGENNARPITIDVSPWIMLYPNGSVTIWHKRNGDSVPEATGAVYDSETMTVTWTPDDVDTYVDGEGDAEIRLTDTNVIKKSKWIKTCVSPSVTLAGTTLGSDWASYINAVDSLRAGAVAAKNAAVAAQAAAETAEGNAEAWAVGQRGGEDVESTDPAYQNNAKYYKEQAAGSASTASTASTAAVAAKNAAVAAQGAAEVAQLAAVTAQGKAETAQAAAETAQGAAELAQESAETAKTGAISAKNDAVSAKNDAVTAKNAAVNAQGAPENSATTASTKAGEAATSATTAGTKAGEAATSAGTASTKASEAAASAGAAGTSALKAEGYAVGDQNGTPVTSGSPYYHNNAEYYAGQASDSATAASGSATTAGNKALVAEGFAVGEQNGTPVTSGSPYYENNAEYFAGQAADSAEEAAASATAAEATTTMIAPAFAEATANDPGTYVTNSGVLYYLPDGHEANVTWANTTKTEVKVGSELAGVKSDLIPGERFQIPLTMGYASGYIDRYKNFNQYSGISAAEIDVVEDQVYYLTSKNIYSGARAVFYDSSNNVISVVYNANNGNLQTLTKITVPTNATKMLIQSFTTEVSYVALYKQNLSEKFGLVSTEIETIRNAATEAETTDIPLTFESETGYIDNTKKSNTYSGVTTATIDVSEGQAYILQTRNFYNAALACLYADNTLYSVVYVAYNDNPVTVEITIPYGITKLVIQRFSAYYPTRIGLITGLKRKRTNNILNGKKITVIGDSITEKNFRAKTNWVRWLTEWCGATFQNLGAGGKGFYNGASTNTNYYSKLSSIQANPDIIGVALSWNDFEDESFPVGEVTDTGTESLAGYANDFFSALITAHPTTPIICYVQSPWGTYKPGYERSDNWNSVLKQICALKGIPYFDEMYYGSALKPWLSANRAVYYVSDDPDAGNVGQSDDVHPNSEGHKVIARHLYPHFAENLVAVGLDYE